MGEVIKGINEIFGKNMKEERDNFIKNGNCGLGPPDLILVIKEVHGIEKKYFHNVYGIPHKSQQDFINYFEELKKNQIQLQKPLFTIKYAFCFSYDCISQKDVCIPSYKVDLNINWKNLSISSVLRFYRHDSSLLYALFGGLPFNYTLSVTLPLFSITLSDLEYAAEIFSFFTSTNEHQLAIARALLCLTNTKEIMVFLHKYANSLPNILVHIAKLIPTNAAIGDGVYFLIENHLDMYSDDLESVFSICGHYIINHETKKCKRYVPLLMQTQTEHPQSAICLARICTAEKKFEDAFSFLNIAALSKGWQMPGLSIDIDPNIVIFGNPYPSIHTEIERELVLNPVTGRTQAYFEAVNELILAMGTHEFLNLASDFAEKHRLYDELNDCQEHPFYYSDSCRSTDEFYLYDPGIEKEANITNDLKKLPYSTRFKTMIKTLMDAHARISSLSSETRTTYKRQDLLLAIRMKDGVIANKVFYYLQKNNKITGVEIMLMLRASLLGIVNFDLNTQPSMLTAEQMAVLPFVRGLIQRINQLERIY